MLKIARSIPVAVIAALALPAAAGSWPNLPARKANTVAQVSAPIVPAPLRSTDGFVLEAGDAGWSLEQYRYFRQEEAPNERFPAQRNAAVAAPYLSGVLSKANDFEYIGGEAGWKLIPHKLVWIAGRLAHSDECDHAIRVVMGPTPAELDSARRLHPGG